jgi:hypothetical protein
MMTTSDSDRLLAAGTPLALTDGREVSLKYGMRSLKILEDQFGDLRTAQNSLAGGGKTIGPLMDLLSAGLLHEGITADELLDLVDPQRLEEYSQALVKAFEVAFPDAVGKAEELLAATNGSSGPSSTTRPRSHSGAATRSSGKK